MVDTSKTTLSLDDAAMMVASAGIEFGADPDKLIAAFKADAGGKPVVFQGDPKETARKVARALSGGVQAAPSPVPAPAAQSSTVTTATRSSGKGTPEQQAAFQKTADDTQEVSRRLLSAFDTSSGQTQQAIRAYGSAAETSGKANAVLAYTKVGAQVDQVKSQELLLDSLGLSASDPQSLLNRKIVEAEGIRGQRELLAAKINENNQIDPLKDPLGWFLGQLKNEVTIHQHNSLVRTENAAFQDITDRKNLAAGQLGISPAAASENLRQIQLAQTAAVSTEAETIAQKARVDAQRAMTADIVERMRLSNVPLDIQAQVLKLNTYNESLRQADTARNEAEQAAEDELRVPNEGRARYGFEPYTKATMRAADPNEKRLWTKLGSGQSIGDSPGETLAAMKFMGIGPEQLVKVDQRKAQAVINLQNGAKQWLGELQTKAANLADVQGSTAAAAELKKLKGGPETVIASVDGYLTDQRADFTSGKAKADNIYKLRIGDAALAGEFAENTAVKAILGGDAKKIPSFGDGEVLGVISAAAKKDLKTIPKLADDLSKLYSKGLENQFVAKGYGTLGIQLPDGYPVILDGKVVNLKDRASVEQYLIYQTTRRTLPLFETPDFVTPYGNRSKLPESGDVRRRSIGP